MRLHLLLPVVLLAGAVLRQEPVSSSLALARIDDIARPQDDLFRFVNGRWLATANIPPDRTTYGTFTELADNAERDLRDVIDRLSATGPHKRGSPQQQIVDLYASAMNVTRRDDLGFEPIRADLNRLEALATPRDFAAEAGRLTAAIAGGPFAITVVVDPRDTGLIAQITQGGTLLPSREHYLSPAPAMAAIREKYVTYLTTVFSLIGRDSARTAALDVLAFETALARLQLAPVDSRVSGRIAPNMTLGAVVQAMPGFDWMAWARPQGLDRAAWIALLQPDFFRGFASLVGRTPMPTLRAWLTSRFLTSMAPYLSRPFVDARFEFFGTALTGQAEPRERWKVGVSLVSGFLGDALGRAYAEHHFPAQARAKATRIVTQVIRAYKGAIAGTTWLSAGTRAEAVAKLSRLTARVGYPDTWRSYAGLSITADDLVGNVTRARRFDSEYRMSRVAGPKDAGEWFVSAQTVNAFYNPGLNTIFLPAAILQPPHFDTSADDADNYGAFGATVGHEISHAFDERGRDYDARGDVRLWWKPEDVRALRERAAPLIDQVRAFQAAPGLRVDPDLTFSENLADVLGLSVAYRAYVESLGGHEAPVINGLTGAQRFFLSYARMWRVKVRDDYLRQWLLTLPYAPYEYRANGPVGHLDAFHTAFGVVSGDALFRAPGARIRIW